MSTLKMYVTKLFTPPENKTQMFIYKQSSNFYLYKFHLLTNHSTVTDFAKLRG